MTDDINIAMGEFQIECDKNKTMWRVTDNFTSQSKDFKSLDKAIDWMRQEIESVEIE